MRRKLGLVFCTVTGDKAHGFDLTSTSKPGWAGLHTDAATRRSAETAMRTAIANQHGVDPTSIVFVQSYRKLRVDQNGPSGTDR